MPRAAGISPGEAPEIDFGGLNKTHNFLQHLNWGVVTNSQKSSGYRTTAFPEPLHAEFLHVNSQRKYRHVIMAREICAKVIFFRFF